MEAEIKKQIDDMGKAWNDFQGAHAIMKTEMEKLGREDIVLKEHIEKAAKATADMHAELTTKFEAMATTLTRVTTESDDTDKDEAKQVRKDAQEMMRIVLVRSGRLQVGDDLPAGYLEDYKQYTKALPKYFRRDSTRLSQDEHKALSAGTDVDGGITIRPVWSNRIIQKIFETSPIRQLATVETISGPELKYPVDINEADCGWVGEQQARNVTNTPQLNEKSIIAHEMYALPKATQTILEDAGIDIEGWLMGKVADKMSRTENTAFVTGNGIAKPRGLMSYPNGTAWGQIEHVNSGTSGAFTVPGLTQTVGQLKEAFHANARWITKRESVPSIMLLQDGDGRYIFQPIFTSGYNNAPLLGYSIVYAADMPTIAAGADAAMFGDFRAAYTIVDRLGITMLRDPYLYKPFVGFYTRKRVGGDVLNYEAFKIVTLT